MSARPLVLLTGAPGSLPGLAALLAAQGFVSEEQPLLRFEPPADWGPLDRALGDLRRYSAIAVTSPRAAEAVAARVRALGVDPGEAPTVWTGAAGAPALRGVFPLVRVPQAPSGGPASLAVVIAGAMLSAGVGSPVLFPCGETHREELPVRLRAAGRRVEQAICYRTVLADRETAAALTRRADIIVATSPTAAQLLAGSRPSVGRAAALVAIGPTTAEAAAAAGWPPEAIAERPAVAAVARAIQSLSLSLS